MESPEVEKEVKRLLRTDLSASNVNILYNYFKYFEDKYILQLQGCIYYSYTEGTFPDLFVDFTLITALNWRKKHGKNV